MEARILRLAVLVAVFASLGASYRTKNFIVNAPSESMAKQIGDAAETFRRDLAIDWLGQEMRNWSQPCPITAQVADNLGAGGATSFVFEHGEVFGWKMTIQGSLVRILDSVLPHEVTHTIFATHFRQPLPRWADEGACTTVEHSSERDKQQKMLIEFLKTERGISFTKMFAMKDYPRDVMPLYSQGYSVARYLIAQKGKREFLEFVADGLRDENWPRAVQAHYGHKDLLSLQTTWLAWVRKGSPLPNTINGEPVLLASTPPPPSSERIAPDTQRGSIAPASLANVDNRPAPEAFDTSDPSSPSIYALAAKDRSVMDRATASHDAWHDKHAGQMAAAAPRDATLAKATPAPPAARAGDRSMPYPVPYQVTRPQPPERPRQVILEWSRPNDSPAVAPAEYAPQAGYPRTAVR